jgi:hypothetical protein
MAFDSRSLDDYVDVAERMGEFYDRYPNGSLRAADPAKPWELAIVTGRKKDGQETTQTFIVVVAAAYRTPDDAAPGIGMAWEVFPGRTPYTLGSELMNAETSAWGRAMAALGIATKRGIASRQEVQRASERAAEPSVDELRAQFNRPPETRADGSATEAELERMRSTPTPGTWRASGTAENDPFYDAAPQPGNGKPPPNMKTMFARYAQLGVTDDDAMRADIGAILGREVASRSGLSQAEVTAVNRVLFDRLAESGVPAR